MLEDRVPERCDSIVLGHDKGYSCDDIGDLGIQIWVEVRSSCCSSGFICILLSDIELVVTGINTDSVVYELTSIINHALGALVLITTYSTVQTTRQTHLEEWVIVLTYHWASHWGTLPL